MYLALRNFVSINEPVAKLIPKFMAYYGNLQSATNEIQIGEKQGVDKTGLLTISIHKIFILLSSVQKFMRL